MEVTVTYGPWTKTRFFWRVLRKNTGVVRSSWCKYYAVSMRFAKKHHVTLPKAFKGDLWELHHLLFSKVITNLLTKIEPRGKHLQITSETKHQWNLKHMLSLFNCVGKNLLKLLPHFPEKNIRVRTFEMLPAVPDSIEKELHESYRIFSEHTPYIPQ